MTHDEALKTIAILKERNDLSLEEICKGLVIIKQSPFFGIPL